MSRPTKDTKNLERVRDNQRRSRARRREHLLELEHRIRSYELNGIEASTEVQQAARRVAEENRLLRALLSRHGFGDDYIMNYLHSGNAPQSDPGAISHFPSGSTSEAVQALQQAVEPRRHGHHDHDHGLSYPISPHETRDQPMVSVPTTTNSIWEPAQPIQPSHSFQRPLPSNAPPPMGRPTISSQIQSQQYTAPFPGPQVQRTGGFHPPPAAPVPMLEDPRRHSYSMPSLAGDASSAMNYTMTMQQFQNPGGSNPSGSDPGPQGPC
ncbi:hypothetical protein AK830_g4161 [Neonectria ditissima]|uniref:BZIP domain-containing protein n=1 Tax=Neonectria ditissima TaxID=78410 RepID=A0A0P7BM04_9HYPO|nr:hypothetical protein AK830_g4161 [Neonectria ditissima]